MGIFPRNFGRNLFWSMANRIAFQNRRRTPSDCWTTAERISEESEGRLRQAKRWSALSPTTMGNCRWWERERYCRQWKASAASKAAGKAAIGEEVYKSEPAKNEIKQVLDKEQQQSKAETCANWLESKPLDELFGSSQNLQQTYSKLTANLQQTGYKKLLPTTISRFSIFYSNEQTNLPDDCGIYIPQITWLDGWLQANS